jgi:hypothetical protein
MMALAWLFVGFALGVGAVLVWQRDRPGLAPNERLDRLRRLCPPPESQG